VEADELADVLLVLDDEDRSLECHGWLFGPDRIGAL